MGLENSNKEKIRTLKIKTDKPLSFTARKGFRNQIISFKAYKISAKYLSFRLQFGMHFHPRFMFLPSLQFSDICWLVNPYQDSIVHEKHYILLYI